MNTITHTDENERTDSQIEEMLNDAFGTVSICGFEYDAGYALKHLDRIAFDMADSDDPLPDTETYECGICGEVYDDESDADDCCFVDDSELLLDQEFDVENASIAPSYFRSRFPDTIGQAGFFDTTSSSGDWGGYIVQEYNGRYHIILFSQENKWPLAGFTVRTAANVIASSDDDFTARDEIDKIISEHMEGV